jgi:hypothetical protein
MLSKAWGKNSCFKVSIIYFKLLSIVSCLMIQAERGVVSPANTLLTSSSLVNNCANLKRTHVQIKTC